MPTTKGRGRSTCTTISGRDVWHCHHVRVQGTNTTSQSQQQSPEHCINASQMSDQDAAVISSASWPCSGINPSCPLLLCEVMKLHGSVEQSKLGIKYLRQKCARIQSSVHTRATVQPSQAAAQLLRAKNPFGDSQSWEFSAMATSQRGSKLRCQETYSSRLPAYTLKRPTRFFQQTKKHAWHYCHPRPRAKKRKASTSLTHTSKTSGNTVSFHSEGSPFPEPERGKAQTQLDGRRTCFCFAV